MVLGILPSLAGSTLLFLAAFLGQRVVGLFDCKLMNSAVLILGTAMCVGIQSLRLNIASFTKFTVHAAA